jgi:transaldolase/transaldolase/glucose-6-phosphate isomerase
MNPLKKLNDFGQTVYMDEIRRSMISSGQLAQLITDDGLRGVTSNPAIFEKAIAQTGDYLEAIAKAVKAGKSVSDIYEDLVIEDIQMAADVFREQYDESDGRYGYISLEVSPKLAYDTQGTIAEARHLHKRLGRPNVFIKVPSTKEGLPAIKQLISDGISVNVTLIFGLDRYREMVDAYMDGLEARAAKGENLSHVFSVASFFLSRMDVLLDPMLEKAGAKDLMGQAAVANAKVAYSIYQELFSTPRWKALEAKGARPQPLLWASTSTKNPNYSDTMYVEPLIGENTINTMPTDTMKAYRDHGNPASRITEGLDDAKIILGKIEALGIDLGKVSQQLEDEGVEKFIKPFESLMKTLEEATKVAA